MALHNKYPRYFYKAGNLFNTYLSYSESEAPPPSREQDPSRTKDARISALIAKDSTPGTRPRRLPAKNNANVRAGAKTKKREAQQGRLTPEASSAASVPERRASFTPSPEAQRLVQFLRENVTQDEALRFLRAVAAHHGVEADARGFAVWAQIGYVATRHIDSATLGRYVTELERRQEAGSALVRE